MDVSSYHYYWVNEWFYVHSLGSQLGVFQSVPSFSKQPCTTPGLGGRAVQLMFWVGGLLGVPLLDVNPTLGTCMRIWREAQSLSSGYNPCFHLWRVWFRVNLVSTPSFMQKSLWTLNIILWRFPTPLGFAEKHSKWSFQHLKGRFKLIKIKNPKQLSFAEHFTSYYSEQVV